MDMKYFLSVIFTVVLLRETVSGTCDVTTSCFSCANSDEEIFISYVCDGEPDCPDEDDEGDCDGEHECESGEVISDQWLCNGILDCSAGDDESECPHCSTDTTNFYECPSSNVCLLKSLYVCDGYAHCDDNSDEANCECDENHQFECTAGVCILNALKCDGEEDCENGSDESDCSLSCTEEQFECLDHGKCVDLTVRCDGNEDCNDGSDEWYCVSLDDSTKAILVKYWGENSPVCASHWNDDWNGIVCKEMGLGTSSTDGTVAQSSLSAYTLNGFIVPESVDNPSSLMDMFHHADTCEGDAVTLTCNNDACGSRSQPNQPSRRKLLQGDDARLGDWPWQVGMHHDGSHNCGGSLISPGWVLTAAHCVDFDLNPANHELRLGTTSSYGNSSQLQTAKVESIHMHEDYNNKTLVNDIALLKLTQDVTINDYVRPICLPVEGETFPAEEYVECYTSGWGGINVAATLYPARLQQLQMDLVSDSTCSSDPDVTDADIFVSDIMICAGYNDNFATICNGDSGGPLVCRSRTTNTWTQAGVVSWGPTSQNASCMGYGVYAQTEHFQSWINGFETGVSLTDLSETDDDTTEMDTTIAGAKMMVADFFSLVLSAMLCIFGFI